MAHFLVFCGGSFANVTGICGANVAHHGNAWLSGWSIYELENWSLQVSPFNLPWMLFKIVAFQKTLISNDNWMAWQTHLQQCKAFRHWAVCLKNLRNSPERLLKAVQSIQTSGKHYKCFKTHDLRSSSCKQEIHQDSMFAERKCGKRTSRNYFFVQQTFLLPNNTHITAPTDLLTGI